MNILLCTLGATWAVIPEVFGFVAPGHLDLYRDASDAQSLQGLRQRYGLEPPDELWVCTTEGERTQQSLVCLNDWWQRLSLPIPLRIWTAAGTDQLATQNECEHLRELTLRLVLLASERCQGGQLVLSLAGGRKTMSADLQWAGSIFGAHAMLHILGPEPLPVELKQPSIELFTKSLRSDLAAAITPVVVDQSCRNELLDVELDGQTVCSSTFSLPLAEPVCSWKMPTTDNTLTANIRSRQRQGSQLLGNFIAQLAKDEHHENWRSLYRLPPAEIARLRQAVLTASDFSWLEGLPKADLHRHLGGSLRLEDQRKVGLAVWTELEDAERARALDVVEPLLTSQDWSWDWPERLKGEHRATNVAALLAHASDTQLFKHLYEVTEPRLGLKSAHPQGFAAYERPGELTGSAILGHKAALKPYVSALVQQARSEGLAYLELRGSPHKYWPDDPVSFVRSLREVLSQSGANNPQDERSPVIRFIWILDRRQPERLAATVEQAVLAHADCPDLLVGLDLAGDEGHGAPETLAPLFEPAFRECLPLTIHAGEGESADNIWQAAYHLHADRIGHGLTLSNRPELAERFRNRGIALELCPTSNREVIGFQDIEVPDSEGFDAYPLKRFMDFGLPLTICTDNPGISRTTLANEYLVASRMMDGGLSHWQTLALIKQGFVHAFLPANEREIIMKRVDSQIYNAIISRISRGSIV